MNTRELGKDKKIAQAIEAFVGSPFFLVIKDAFVSHTPAGEGEAVKSSTSDPLLVAHGKNLGTRFVFNELENIVAQAKAPKQQARPTGPDPDLAT
jgi:hypothetical protein